MSSNGATPAIVVDGLTKHFDEVQAVRGVDFEVAPGEYDQVRDLVCAAMAGAASLRVPLEVSVGTGRSWAEAAH